MLTQIWANLTGMKPKWSYIVATDYATNFYAGDIYYWNGSTWVGAGTNNTDLLDAFTGAWVKNENLYQYKPFA